MNKKLILILGLAFLGGIAFVALRPKPAAEAAKGAVKYQCPMHPQIVRDEPGDCPICHMKLEKVIMDAGHDHSQAANSGDAHAAFTLSESRQQLIGVKSEAVEKREIIKTLRLPGRVGDGRTTVLAQALEMDGGSLRPGLKASVKLAESAPVGAVVSAVDSRLDSYSRTFGVILALTEAAPSVMRPGVYCDVRVELKSLKALAVPKDAVLDTGERQMVFVAKEGGRFEPREVTLGREGDSHVEISKGLKEGERVVIRANFLIDSESRFKAAVSQF